MGSRNAPFGRRVVGVSALSTLTMSAPPPTTPVQLTVASSTLDTPILVAIVRRLWLDIFATNWRLHMPKQSGTTLTPVMKGLTFSCVAATL